MDLDNLPRHLRVAMSNAQQAFERDDIASLATINEDIQGLIDAAVAWGRRGARMAPLRYDACIGDGCGDQDLADLDQRTGLCGSCARQADRAKKGDIAKLPYDLSVASVVEPDPLSNTCNKHDDCTAADLKAKAMGKSRAVHCYDECCEECFGS